MSASKEQSLSSEDIRKRLYQTFKNRGVLDSLKTQLRNQLIQELHPPLAHASCPSAATAHEHPVSLLASNSLVIDHLQSSGYEYTLSVFYPECGVSKDKVFSTRDLLQFMKISPHSPIYESLVSNVQKGKQGLLISLLSELIDHRIHSELRDVDTQTSTAQSSGESLVRKLQVIDEEYEDLRQKGGRWASVEVKLAAYRKEMEEQSEAELKVKLRHFQEVELVRVRKEEQDRCRQELMELTRSLERTYEQKTEALINREKNAIERLQKQQEIEEKETYNQRQALLKQLEVVRNRENELRHQVEAFEKSCKVHEEHVRSTEERLRRREVAVKTLEDTYDHKLNNELRTYQLELKDDYTRRTAKLTDDEKRNKEEMLRLQKEATVLDSKTAEYSRTASELKRVQTELEALQAEVGVLTQQNVLLRESLEAVGDHAALRRERTELHAHVRLLKDQLQERQQEVQRLSRERSAPSQEVLALQTEVRRLETALHLCQEELQNQKQVFHTQLAQEVERSAHLKSQLLECEERTRWMSAHTEEIKQQLRYTQQALENEVFRNPKPSLEDHPILHLSSNNVVSPGLYMEGALLKARLSSNEGICDPGLANKAQQPLWPCGDSAEPNTERVVAAMARIRELEKEAESLEEAYRTYQRRARAAVARIPSGGPSPTRATSHYIRPVAPDSHRLTFPLNQPAMPSLFMERELNQAPVPNNRTPPTVGSPPPRVGSPPPRVGSPPPRVGSPPPRMGSPPPTVGSPPPTVGSPPPRMGSPPPRMGSPPPRVGSPPPTVGSPPPRMGSPPPRRLSSTPVSASKARSRLYNDHECPGFSGGDRAVVTFASLSPGNVMSPIPAATIESSGDYTHITPPYSPRRKTSAPDHCRSPKLQDVVSTSCGSSPQPEKICLEDLTETQPDLQCSSEQLEDTQRITPFAHTPGSPREQECPLPLPHADDRMIPCSNATAGKGDEDEEGGEKGWQEERRKKEEQRRKEREEAQEYERREYERLEQEHKLQEDLCERGGMGHVKELQCDEGHVKGDVDTAGADVPKSPFTRGGGVKTGEEPTAHTEPADPPHTEPADPLHTEPGDPLHTYMMMVMEGRDTGKQQVSQRKEDSESQSPDPRLDADKDNSVEL
ncbi:centriole and centriolar satellite protein ofd1 isoform X2 [Brachyhypopomus gauderio]|uniref:centriole and centriolar satellite protein ofd1 isoform X2 n=1 Tax=Brachyhypopomus gauderio TaxID=698409 RepID=UPI004041164C